MKKLFLSIIAILILSTVTVYADGGKKPVKKAPHKKVNTKAKCPNRPGCICN
ncbi:MAG: hypothetical protein IPP96_11000 [Chitinophagaceae bacterium]|nr:hypothetical protein [Chitinophagaceae bacterium]